jgi:hypothetical protein
MGGLTRRATVQIGQPYFAVSGATSVDFWARKDGTGTVDRNKDLSTTGSASTVPTRGKYRLQVLPLRKHEEVKVDHGVQR